MLDGLFVGNIALLLFFVLMLVGGISSGKVVGEPGQVLVVLTAIFVAACNTVHFYNLIK